MDVRKKNNSGKNREFIPETLKIAIGLGNRGENYRATYHNAGFLALDDFSGRVPENEWRKSKNFVFLKSGRIILAKPTVFMNESGKAAKQALAYFKIKPENMILIHDDSDIEIGDFKIAFGRGAAGHRGVSSVIDALKTKDFWRARLGVRHRPGKAGNFVLKKISRDDEDKLKDAFTRLGKILSEETD
ncbi:MAG: aminoacyl-tRNA hydrolase [Minisyncoccia bacterium]